MSTVTTLNERLSASGLSTKPRNSVDSQVQTTPRIPPTAIHGQMPRSGIRAREHHNPSDIELEHLRPPFVSEAQHAVASSGKSASGSEPEFPMSYRDEKIFLATLSFNLGTAGWNDGTLGPLLLRLQEHYRIGYTIVSLLFVISCVGFIAGAFSNVFMYQRLGFGKTITLAAAVQIAAYTTLATAPPYPVFCGALFFNGWAVSLQDAGSNSFVASIPRNEKTNMGILHAVYGVGAFAAPFVATQFSQQKHWSFHYLISTGVSILNVALLLYVFRLKDQSHFIPETTPSDQSGQQQQPASDNLYKQIMQQKIVHVMAFFILVYVGVEVTIGGWIFTYLVEERGAGASAGYVSSGFFGGLTLGRILLLPVNAWIGQERVIYLYSILAMALELTIWFVPSLIGNAVAVSIVGLLLGPFYPIAMNVLAGLLPRWLLAGSIGWIGAFGPTGAALFPFMTGALASKYGVQVLQPLLVAMMAIQIGLWFFVTRAKVSRQD